MSDQMAKPCHKHFYLFTKYLEADTAFNTSHQAKTLHYVCNSIGYNSHHDSFINGRGCWRDSNLRPSNVLPTELLSFTPVNHFVLLLSIHFDWI